MTQKNSTRTPPSCQACPMSKEMQCSNPACLVFLSTAYCVPMGAQRSMKFQKFLLHHCKNIILPNRAGLHAQRIWRPVPFQCERTFLDCSGFQDRELPTEWKFGKDKLITEYSEFKFWKSQGRRETYFLRLHILYLQSIIISPSLSVLKFLHSHTSITKIGGRFCKLISNSGKPHGCNRCLNKPKCRLVIVFFPLHNFTLPPPQLCANRTSGWDVEFHYIKVVWWVDQGVRRSIIWTSSLYR